MISSQAITVLIIEVVKIIAVIIAIAVSKEVSISAKLAGITSSIIVMGAGAYLLFKSVNCMVYGECGMYAWVIVGVMLVVFVIASVGSVVGFKHFTSVQDELNKQIQSINAQAFAKLTTPIYEQSKAEVPVNPITPSATVKIGEVVTPVTAASSTIKTTP